MLLKDAALIIFHKHSYVHLLETYCQEQHHVSHSLRRILRLAFNRDYLNLHLKRVYYFRVLEKEDHFKADLSSSTQPGSR